MNNKESNQSNHSKKHRSIGEKMDRERFLSARKALLKNWIKELEDRHRLTVRNLEKSLQNGDIEAAKSFTAIMRQITEMRIFALNGLIDKLLKVEINPSYKLPKNPVSAIEIHKCESSFIVGINNFTSKWELEIEDGNFWVDEDLLLDFIGLPVPGAVSH